MSPFAMPVDKSCVHFMCVGENVLKHVCFLDVMVKSDHLARVLEG